MDYHFDPAALTTLAVQLNGQAAYCEDLTRSEAEPDSSGEDAYWLRYAANQLTAAAERLRWAGQCLAQAGFGSQQPPAPPPKLNGKCEVCQDEPAMVCFNCSYDPDEAPEPEESFYDFHAELNGWPPIVKTLAGAAYYP